MASEEELLSRLKKLKNQFNNMDSIKPQLEKQGNSVVVKGSDLIFNSDDISKLEALLQNSDPAAKVAQSDVPDNMLALLTALKATQK